jgi:iron complex outermembrane receptor protein
MRSNQATISKTRSYFTEWSLRLPSDISLTAGVGLSTMDLILNDRFYVPSTNRPVRKIPTQFSASYKDMVSPHFAINKVFSKALSVYASYSKGYKAPVSSYFYIPTTGEVNRNLRPEIGEQVEAGTKGNLFKDKLHYQAAYFDVTYYQKMTAVAVPLNSVTTAYSYMVNGGTQHNKGVEFLLKLNLIEKSSGIIRSLKPFANFCYSNFMYGEFKFQTLNAARTAVVTTDYTKKVVAGVPPLTANAGVDIGLSFGIYGSVNYMYRDAMYFTSDNANKTKSYGVLNAKLGVRRTIAKHVELDVYAGANNITGTQYYYMVFLNQLPDAYLPAPREINYFGGINLRYIF